MVIAVTQLAMIWENKDATMVKCCDMVREAAGQGADLIVFPEMTLTGFSMNTAKTAENPAHPETVLRMCRLSEECGIAIAFGYVERKEGGKAYNCLDVVKDGAVIFHYAKIHPFTYGEEGTCFLGGDTVTSCELGGIGLGGFICYDLRFPEIFQISSTHNQAILVIASWPMERAAHWETLLRARAIENQCIIIGVNRIGEGGGLHYVPGTMIFGPSGEEILAPWEGEGIRTARLLPEQVTAIREDFPLKKDRRNDLYRSLMTKDKKDLTTLCYVEKDDSFLMLHRVSKKNDVNRDKWIGIGGHFEEGESPEECLLREAWEETGLRLTSFRFRGIITFSLKGMGTEYMCLYTADGFEGEIGACEEGTLKWVNKSDVEKLNLWTGDLIFLRLLAEESPFFSLKLSYDGDRLEEAVLDGRKLELN